MRALAVGERPWKDSRRIRPQVAGEDSYRFSGREVVPRQPQDQAAGCREKKPPVVGEGLRAGR